MVADLVYLQTLASEVKLTDDGEPDQEGKKVSLHHGACFKTPMGLLVIFQNKKYDINICIIVQKKICYERKFKNPVGTLKLLTATCIFAQVALAAEDAISFLCKRQEFWRQFKPMYSEGAGAGGRFAGVRTEAFRMQQEKHARRISQVRV